MPVDIGAERRRVRIQTRLLLLDCRLFLPCACSFGFAFTTVGELGTGGAGDIVEDSRLNTFQEGHLGLLEGRERGAMSGYR